jgi:hypothetical protein
MLHHKPEGNTEATFEHLIDLYRETDLQAFPKIIARVSTEAEKGVIFKVGSLKSEV